jgi:hypothetical protein
VVIKGSLHNVLQAFDSPWPGFLTSSVKSISGDDVLTGMGTLVTGCVWLCRLVRCLD